MALTKEVLEHLVRVKKFTDKEAAKELGLSAAYIYECRHKWGIPRTQLWENIPIRSVGELTQLQRDCIEGTLLGDTSIGKTASEFCCFSCGHSIKQLEYTRYVASILDPFLSSRAREQIDKVEKKHLPDGKWDCFGFKTRVHPIFNYYWDFFYPPEIKDGELVREKIFPERLLEHLNANHLAFWYLDDGTLDGVSFSICMSFPNMDSRLKTKIVKILYERFNLNCCFSKPAPLESGVVMNDLRILADSTLTFLEFVKPHLTRDTTYKIPAEYLDGEPPRKVARPKIVVVKRRFEDGKIIETRICQHPECKKEFEINNANHSIYCTDKCAEKGFDARKKEKNEHKRHKKCVWCKKKFYDDSYAQSYKFCLDCRNLKPRPKKCRGCNKWFKGAKVLYCEKCTIQLQEFLKTQDLKDKNPKRFRFCRSCHQIFYDSISKLHGCRIRCPECESKR